MGLLGNRGGGKLKFQMRQELISIGDDYWIEDGDGHRAYRVNGKALRMRDTWVLEDTHGNEVAKIKERKLTVRDTMKIEFGGKEATVKKALVGFRERFHIEIDDGPELKAHGNIVDHEYEIEYDGRGGTVAEISKKWFRLRDTYGVEIEGDIDPALILAITVAIDSMTDRK